MRVLSLICTCCLLTSCAQFIQMVDQYERDKLTRFAKEEREKEKLKAQLDLIPAEFPLEQEPIVDIAPITLEL